MTQTARVTRHAIIIALVVTVNSLALFTRDSTIRTALFFDFALTIPFCY